MTKTTKNEILRLSKYLEKCKQQLIMEKNPNKIAFIRRDIGKTERKIESLKV